MSEPPRDGRTASSLERPRVVVVAGGPALGQALRSLLEGGQCTVVGEHTSLDGIGPATGADVIVIGDSPGASLLGGRRPAIRMIVVGGDPVAACRWLAVDGQPWALLPAKVDGATLGAAIRAVIAGLSVGPPSLMSPDTAELGSVPEPASSRTQMDAGEFDEGPIEALTPRELEVLTALAEGLSNRAIARRLGISDHTVKFHLESIFGKLGATSRTGAVRRGLRRGLIGI